ncbi:hypothetical protein CRI77_16385 [Mycolicibacterium duvalii]|uniref:Uncharacterized protein n=1 Tax=Mycolicibacterium duvalii TaxID=39688 RepID=A0A7I7K3F2_9MYCO|nr:hypothetical protein [Mycolicibacterium duvalii]MCV7367477.1 hypothetical protein [Mycolicibacterium duvalii]PEG39209.1 hypothetical protein CRI77_16385 [Mycolicibacterium duvalii]BBX17902.1 hypothetical protein MDUV_27620 [Mycolicibacterium duvalii]
MDLSTTLVVIAAALLLAATALTWWLRRRAAFQSALQQRGWRLRTDGDDTVVVPATGDWTLTMRRSYVGQMSPPGKHLVTSVWTCPMPATLGPVLVAGPAPPPELRELAAGLVGSVSPTVTRWLGIDRVSDGRPLRPVPAMDDRLLVFATDGIGPIGTLRAVADAIGDWCSVYETEREQPVLLLDRSGMSVRVRTDVLTSVDVADAFVTLGLRCRGALGRS